MVARIIIADDHELLRRGLRATLSERSDWAVSGEASGVREAAALVEELHPDVAILDVTMPELNGLEATRMIRSRSPSTAVLILTVHDTEQLIREVLDAGAQGYLLKSDAGRDLIAAVEALLRGKPYFTSTVARLVLAGFLASRGERGEGTSVLSIREREIVQMVAEGKSTKEVAAALGISAATAETHRTNIMHKLGLHSVAELVRYAIRNRLVEA